MTTKQHESSAPLGTATGGRLEVVRAPSRFTLDAREEFVELYRARFDGVAPMVFAADGRITLEYPRLSPPDWRRPRRPAAEVTLSLSVSWELVFRRGVSRLRADLRRLQLTAFDVGGGADEGQILLPEPNGLVPIRIAGGASKLTLLRPRDVATVLRVWGGASRLAFDGERYGAIGGETRLEALGGERSQNRYEIEILGGAADLTVAEHEGGVDR